MKAWEVQPGAAALDDLKLVTRDDPAPGPGQVLVRVRATSINARDQAIVAGRYRMGALTRPTIILSDGAGEVVSVGEGAGRFAIGERVAGCFVQGWGDGA